MATFNVQQARKNLTHNRAGGQAFRESPELALTTLLLTSFAQGQYYRSASQAFSELAGLLEQVDAQFAAKAALYGRHEYHMRSITHVLAAELSPYAAGREWAKRFYDRIVVRPDDMLEIAAYYLLSTESRRHLPNAMKKGFAAAFGRFDGYQLAKYRGEDKAVKLIDLVNLVHPVPTPRNEKALRALVAGTLRNEQTWETRLSRAGEEAESEEDKAKRKTEVWAGLLRENRLGYFALVRNLRNILAQAPALSEEVCAQLTDPQRVRRSRVLPFRLLTAYKQLRGENDRTRSVQKALEEALELSCSNLPALDNTLVVIDNSGSMNSPVAGSPYLQCNEAGAAFAMMLAKRSNADVMEFGDTARMIPYRLSDSVLGFAQRFHAENQVGFGTNFHAIFEAAPKAYDRIVIFSDMQGWIGHDAPTDTFGAYKKRTGADPYIYSFDLRGYGSLQFPEKKVLALAGFSEKAFEVMGIIESDPQALLNAIKAVEL